MREFISSDVIANTISMLASNRDGAIWISDSDDDAKFYEMRCASRQAAVVPATGQASKVLLVVRERGLQGVVATVMDPDHVLLEDEFRLAAGDVPSLLVYSESFWLVIESIVGRTWMDAAEKLTRGFKVRVDQLARVWDRIVHRSPLDFNDQLVVFKGLIKRSAFELDPSATRRYLKSIDRAELIEDLEGSASIIERELPRPSGRAVLVVLAAALQMFRPRGIPPSSILSPSELLSQLRIGYNINELESDEMFWRMRAWQRTSGYPLLREWRLSDPLGVLLDQRYWAMDLRMLIKVRGYSVLAVMKMDLDHFRDVNNTIGHESGDEAIRIYCKAVKSVLGAYADVYRRGGDEVIAFAPGMELHDARAKAEELRIAISDQFAEWEHAAKIPRPLTASIGLVHCCTRTPEPTILKAVDDAQMRAKQQGRNRVVEIVLPPN